MNVEYIIKKILRWDLWNTTQVNVALENVSMKLFEKATCRYEFTDSLFYTNIMT